MPASKAGSRRAVGRCRKRRPRASRARCGRGGCSGSDSSRGRRGAASRRSSHTSLPRRTAGGRPGRRPGPQPRRRPRSARHEVAAASRPRPRFGARAVRHRGSPTTARAPAASGSSTSSKRQRGGERAEPYGQDAQPPDDRVEFLSADVGVAVDRERVDVILQALVRDQREHQKPGRGERQEHHDDEPDRARCVASSPGTGANVRRGVSRGFMHSCRTLLRGPMTSGGP